jgi:hypothetical protein
VRHRRAWEHEITASVESRAAESEAEADAALALEDWIFTGS